MWIGLSRGGRRHPASDRRPTAPARHLSAAGSWWTPSVGWTRDGSRSEECRVWTPYRRARAGSGEPDELRAFREWLRADPEMMEALELAMGAG